jgi:hypothetical protein
MFAAARTTRKAPRRSAYDAPGTTIGPPFDGVALRDHHFAGPHNEGLVLLKATLHFANVELEVTSDLPGLARDIKNAIDGSGSPWVDLTTADGEVSLLVTSTVPIWLDRRTGPGF